MATLTATGHKLILEKRRWDDYASMKQYFQNSNTKEVLFAGSQLLTTSYATIDGSDHTIAAQKTSADTAFLSTIADDATQRAKSVWVVYQDNTGAIQTAVETLLETSDCSDEIPIGYDGTDHLDTVNGAPAGNAVTMTGMAGTLNEYTGWVMVGCTGDNIGTVFPILTNTNATPTVITLSGVPATPADLAADTVSVQPASTDDFYRVREMWCEIEVLDSKTIRLGDTDSTAVYAGIGEGHRYMANSGIFTQPTATCDTYLGRIKASAAIDTTVTEAKGCQVKVFYTPAEAHADGGAVETELEIPFHSHLDWQPCIKLAPATDVVIQVKYIAGAIVDEIFLEASYLEVYK